MILRISPISCSWHQNQRKRAAGALYERALMGVVTSDFQRDPSPASSSVLFLLHETNQSSGLHHKSVFFTAQEKPAQGLL